MTAAGTAPHERGVGRLAEHLLVIHRAEYEKYEEYSENQSKISYPVHDKRLSAGIGVLRILVPETDEEVGREADAFPADEHEEGSCCPARG